MRYRPDRSWRKKISNHRFPRWMMFLSAIPLTGFFVEREEDACMI